MALRGGEGEDVAHPVAQNRHSSGHCCGVSIIGKVMKMNEIVTLWSKFQKSRPQDLGPCTFSRVGHLAWSPTMDKV